MDTYERALEALGDGTRRQILRCLRATPTTVGDLAAQLPVSRPAISQHLRVLRDCHLVTFEPAGTRNIYRVDPAGLESLRSWIDDFWMAVLDSFAAYTEHEATAGGPGTKGLDDA